MISDTYLRERVWGELSTEYQSTIKIQQKLGMGRVRLMKELVRLYLYGKLELLEYKGGKLWKIKEEGK